WPERGGGTRRQARWRMQWIAFAALSRRRRWPTGGCSFCGEPAGAGKYAAVLRDPAKYVAVDLQFDDGSHLSTRGAVDQHRIGVSAHAQGEGRTLYPDQWNYLSIDLGRVAAGRTIKRI